MNSFLFGRYILYMLATYAILLAISMILNQVGWQLPTGVGTVMSSMLPALWVGNTYFKRYETVPESGFAWKISLYFTLIHLVFALLVVVLIVTILPVFDGLLKGSGAWLFLVAAVFLGVIMYFTTRFFFMMGAKQAEKASV